MSEDRFAELERLYHETIARPSAERAAFLDEACGGDDALRQEVESLLSFQAGADEFLSRPAIEEAARSGQRALEADPWPTIPGYTVIRVLGEGGMGVVYLAWQETPFRRLVALKLIKPGMDTRQVVARFETERQALALMDHPNIAAVFDAGSTAQGRPYFVMEFVEGVCITEYCDRGRLSTHDRLALFVQVCAAVQHAHQKGVIHRDLKPSNVVVAERDGHAVPKVIDFGTAKAVGGIWNATATQAGEGMVIGTLEYMSPEQAALSTDIDTATDVYSLGVLLYELLVGRLPFDTAELRAAGHDEMRRVIRESEPPKPSSRVDRRTDKSGAAARARQTDAPGLTRQLRGDLDWITLKALEKDRTRRYATVAAFATDIGRFLVNQPVDARPPSSTYRIRKFARRHRLAVAAVAIIVTILSAGVAVTAGLYWQVREALRDSTYLAYTATLAAAAGDLRDGATSEARTRLLAVPETQRGWEWQHLFIQADETLFSFASAVQPCEWALSRPATSMITTALSLDADGGAILLRRCSGFDRWTLPTLAHTAWTATPRTVILAGNSRGQILTTSVNPTNPLSYRLVLTDRTGSTGTATFGPFATRPACADISPDGIRIAFGLPPKRLDAFEARSDVFEVWNAATSRVEFRLVTAPTALVDTHAPDSCGIRFSPDGRRIATSGATVNVWDAVTRAHEQASDTLQAGAYSQAIAFNRDGDQLAIGRPSGLVDVLDIGHSPPTLHRLSANGLVVEASIDTADRVGQAYARRKHQVLAVAFSPDGQTVVSGTSTNVGIWDIRQSKLVRVLSGHTAEVVSVVASADRIYSVDTAGVVRAWLSNSARAVTRTDGPFVNVRPISASADGSIVATATSDGALTAVWSVDLHQEVIRAGIGQTAGETQLPLSVAISPDGLRLFAVEFGGAIRRSTIGSKDSVAVSTSLKTFESRLAVSPSGALLASTQGNSVAVWDTSTMKQQAGLDMAATARDLLFRDEETLIISTAPTAPTAPNQNPPPRVRIWNWRTNRELSTVEPKLAVGPHNVVWRLALSPDGRRIAVMSSTTVSIWDRDLKAEIGRLPPGDYQAVAFSADGRRIVSVGAQESAVRVWDAERLLPLLTLPDTDSHLGGVAFTRAGQIVAGRTGGGLTIWDTQIRQR